MSVRFGTISTIITHGNAPNSLPLCMHDYLEADSLEEARRKLYTDAVIVLQETVIQQERVDSIEGHGATIREAALDVKKRIPLGARIEQRAVMVPPQRITLKVRASNEANVGHKIDLQPYECIELITLYKRGTKGFLGIGKALDMYEVIIQRNAVVEVRCRLSARIRDQGSKTIMRLLRSIISVSELSVKGGVAILSASKSVIAIISETARAYAERRGRMNELSYCRLHCHPSVTNACSS